MKPFAQLNVLFRTLFNRLMRRAVKPQDVMAYAIDKITDAHRQLQVQCAELVAARDRAVATLNQLNAGTNSNSALVGTMKTQIASYNTRIDQMRTQLIDMDNKVAILKARRTDLSIRANLLDTSDQVNQLLGQFGATSLDKVFDGIEDDVAHRESVNQILAEIESGKFLEGGR